jgi:membrane-bound lytic murein transglycosylase D
VIVKRYQGATFGFASRNFYVAFLAALEVDRNAEKYFGPMSRLPDTENTPVQLPDYIAVSNLAKAFKVDMGALKVLNPALRPPIWSGARLVPRGYAMRLPGTQSESVIAAALTRIPAAQRYLAQRNDGAHRVRRGETLAGIAAASGMSLSRLSAANGWNTGHAIARGEIVRVPMPPTRAEVAGEAPAAAALAENAAAAGAPLATPPAGGSEQAAEPEKTPPPPAKAPPPPREPVSARQTESAALLPAGAPTGSTDTTDYGVGPEDTVVVQVAETLGHFADWSHVDSQTLRRLNKLHKDAGVRVGRRIKLDLSKVSADDFVAARREYHHHLQEDFFASHRIAGTENYVVKRGESLWTIAQQRNDMPVWLVAQYNPDVNFNDVRPGTQITLPRLESINRQ